MSVAKNFANCLSDMSLLFSEDIYMLYYFWVCYTTTFLSEIYPRIIFLSPYKKLTFLYLKKLSLKMIKQKLKS